MWTASSIRKARARNRLKEMTEAKEQFARFKQAIESDKKKRLTNAKDKQ